MDFLGCSRIFVLRFPSFLCFENILPSYVIIYLLSIIMFQLAQKKKKLLF